MIVLDTNLLSELMKPRPSPAVLDWFDRQPTDRKVTTAVSVFEIAFGIERLGETRRASELLERFEALLAGPYLGDVLPFTSISARLSAFVMATRTRLGRPIGSADAQIAGIALEHGAALATRNTRDFLGVRIQLVNPWEPGAPR